MTEEPTRGVWEQQFDTSFDFPQTSVKTKYVICTSPRCGSHHLGHLLHDTGGFGYPLEYMNAANLKIWARRAQGAGMASPLAYIKSVRTDRNGVFGIKVHFSQLATLLAHERDVLQYRYITLERWDILKQAVSYSWAAQTKSWISGMPPLGTAAYDWSSISSKLEEIVRSNAGWQRFLAGLGVKPLELVHEEILADPKRAVDRIERFLEIDRAPKAIGPRFVPREQAEPGKAEWVQRFISDSRERLSRGEFAGDHRGIRTHLLRTIGSLLKSRTD